MIEDAKIKMSRLKKFINYFDSFGDVVLFIRISIFVTVLPPLLKIFSLKNLMKHLSSDITKEPDPKKAAKVLQLTNLLLNRNVFVYKNVCLKRSLTLYYFLSRMGQDVSIYYGVKKGEIGNDSYSPLEGHCWIKLNGEIFNDGDMDAPATYQVTYSYPN